MPVSWPALSQPSIKYGAWAASSSTVRERLSSYAGTCDRGCRLVPPTKAAISLFLLSLKHFDLTAGIRCTKAIPQIIFLFNFLLFNFLRKKVLDR